ncbi:MAG: serine hydroxymethyltransferase [Clostridiales bacterium]|nr:serine hydroxymethyltransferase [Clostridiales bacterium]
MAEILAKADPEIAAAVTKEKERQTNKIELIASENYVSPAVMAAMGTELTNKYAEGYPGNRYYGGCEYVDIVETLAIDRVKAVFGAEHANVQPHAGVQANIAAYFAMLDAGDTIVGMSLTHGGHLSHGSPANLSGKYYKFHHYGVREDTEVIDYDELRDLMLKVRPKLLVAGASAYPRKIDYKTMSDIAKEVGSLFMVDMAHIAGLVAAGLHPNPTPYADVVTGTTHKTFRGPRGGLILCKKELAKAIDKAIFPGTQGGPLMHVIAAKAVSFKEALTPQFKAYQQQIVANAQALASALQKRGFRLISGGTDNHLMLVDVRPKKLTGKAAEKLLDEVGATANKNAIPFDTENPLITSGVRMGTPATTTRGMKEGEMERIADIVDMVLSNPEDQQIMLKAKLLVRELTDSFPLFAEEWRV